MSAEEPKNGHCKERTEVRSEVLELNARRNQIESEIKEYNDILRQVSSAFLKFKQYSYTVDVYCRITSAWTIRWSIVKASLETTLTYIKCAWHVIA